MQEQLKLSRNLADYVHCLSPSQCFTSPVSLRRAFVGTNRITWLRLVKSYGQES